MTVGCLEPHPSDVPGEAIPLPARAAWRGDQARALRAIQLSHPVRWHTPMQDARKRQKEVDGVEWVQWVGVSSDLAWPSQDPCSWSCYLSPVVRCDFGCGAISAARTPICSPSSPSQCPLLYLPPRQLLQPRAVPLCPALSTPSSQLLVGTPEAFANLTSPAP